MCWQANMCGEEKWNRTSEQKERAIFISSFFIFCILTIIIIRAMSFSSPHNMIVFIFFFECITLRLSGLTAFTVLHAVIVFYRQSHAHSYTTQYSYPFIFKCTDWTRVFDQSLFHSYRVFTLPKLTMMQKKKNNKTKQKKCIQSLVSILLYCNSVRYILSLDLSLSLFLSLLFLFRLLLLGVFSL